MDGGEEIVRVQGDGLTRKGMVPGTLFHRLCILWRKAKHNCKQTVQFDEINYWPSIDYATMR